MCELYVCFALRLQRLLCRWRMLSEVAERMLPEELTAAFASGIVFQSRCPKVKADNETNLSANCGFWGIAVRKWCFYLPLLTFYLMLPERESSNVFFILWENNYNLSGTWLFAFLPGVQRWFTKARFTARLTCDCLNSGSKVQNIWYFFDSCICLSFIYSTDIWVPTMCQRLWSWILGIQSWVKRLAIIVMIMWQERTTVMNTKTASLLARSIFL